MKKLNKKLIIPTIVALAIYLTSYSLPKSLNHTTLHYVSLPIDDLIPCFSWAIIIYVLAFFQWILGAIIVNMNDTDKGYYCISCFIIGSLIGMCVFIIYPTAIVQKPLQVHNIFDAFTNLIYAIDSNTNCLPSFHCFVSWTFTRCLFKYDNLSIRFKFLFLLFSILVFASTVLTKQHYFIDIPTGILLAEISLLLAKRINFKKLFELIK